MFRLLRDDKMVEADVTGFHLASMYLWQRHPHLVIRQSEKEHKSQLLMILWGDGRVGWILLTKMTTDLLKKYHVLLILVEYEDNGSSFTLLK